MIEGFFVHALSLRCLNSCFLGLLGGHDLRHHVQSELRLGRLVIEPSCATAISPVERALLPVATPAARRISRVAEAIFSEAIAITFGCGCGGDGRGGIVVGGEDVGEGNGGIFIRKWGLIVMITFM